MFKITVPATRVTKPKVIPNRQILILFLLNIKNISAKSTIIATAAVCTAFLIGITIPSREAHLSPIKIRKEPILQHTNPIASPRSGIKDKMR